MTVNAEQNIAGSENSGGIRKWYHSAHDAAILVGCQTVIGPLGLVQAVFRVNPQGANAGKRNIRAGYASVRQLLQKMLNNFGRDRIANVFAIGQHRPGHPDQTTV
jgi:hypothetical protein